jgi:cyclopropane fatty-acyl-phospholipid synthase-like methyltransferase
MSGAGKVSGHYLGQAGEAYVAARQSPRREEYGYRLNLEHFLPYLRPDDRVLDFGAGTGGMLRLLRAHVAEAEGLEVNPAAARLAREHSGCTVYESLEQVAAGERYDAVVSNHVLEHVRDVCSTLEQVRERMKRGGRLVLKLPLDDWRDPAQRAWSRGDVNHHLHTWSPRSLANTLYESGFDVRESRVLTQAWHPRLFWLRRFGLDRAAFWALAALKHRRQLVAVALRP